MKNVISKFLSKIKYSLLTGFLVVIPIWVTYLFLKTIISLYHKFFVPTINLLQRFQIPYPNIIIPLTGTILFLLVLTLIGMFTQNVIGKKVLYLWESILQKLPFISTIYNLIKQFVETLVSYQKRGFKRVAIVEWPRKGCYVFGFVTSETAAQLSKSIEEDKLLNIFLPTTPNPTSGYLIMVREEDVKILDMKVEEAIKLIVSGGIVQKTDV